MIHLLRMFAERLLPPWITGGVYLLVSIYLVISPETVQKWQFDLYASFLLALICFQIIQFFFLFFIFIGRSKLFDDGQVDSYSWELIDAKNAKIVVDKFALIGFVISLSAVILLLIYRGYSMHVIGLGFACLSFLELFSRPEAMKTSRLFIREHGGYTLIALVVGLAAFQISDENIIDLLRVSSSDGHKQQSLTAIIGGWGGLYFFMRLCYFLCLNKLKFH